MKYGSLAATIIRKQLICNSLKGRNRSGVLLDLGCGERPYKNEYDVYVKKSVGIDVPWSLHEKHHIDAFGKAEMLGFKNESFDVILFTSVLEHVENPSKALQEASRVLKNNGILILTVPFMVPLHEQPYDFYRFTPFSLEILLDEARFKVQKIIPIGEILFVCFSFFNRLYLKIWWNTSKLPGLKILYSLWNPAIFLVTYVPQKLYALLVLRSISKKKGLLYRWYKRMAYACHEYFILAFVDDATLNRTKEG